MPSSLAALYEFSDFRLDAAKRLLLKGQDEVPLTPKVFDTLLYLVQHSGELIQKNELMRAIWPDTVVAENNLNQNISTLRRAFGEGSYIVTVPGHGYRFVAEVKERNEKRPEQQHRAVASIQNLAVLPFTPLVAEQRDTALELGMADALIARLGSNRIIVRPINSVRRFIDFDQDPLAAGRELRVESVLTGSIQRSDDNIRVRVRLLNVGDSATLWAGTFDEIFTNVFAVQDAIAEKVANALAPQLGYEDKQRLIKSYTRDSQAYELYARGRFHALKATPIEIELAVSHFQQAINLDPKYALAYVGLADAYRSFPLNSDMPPEKYFPAAKRALQQAIEIDDGLADAHGVLGFTIFWYDWDWQRCESELKRALDLDPHSADTHLAYAHLLSNTGRHVEALAEAKRARELDPLNLRCNALEGQFLNHAGHTDKALARLHKAFELDANYFLAHLFAWSAYVEKRMYKEAIAEARRALELNEASVQPRAYLAYALARSGEERKARVELEQLLKLSTERWIPPYLIALVHNALGKRNEALAHLERGYEQRDPKMVFLMVEPKWKNLSSDPRFQELLRRLRLK